MLKVLVIPEVCGRGLLSYLLYLMSTWPNFSAYFGIEWLIIKHTTQGPIFYLIPCSSYFESNPNFNCNKPIIVLYEWVDLTKTAKLRQDEHLSSTSQGQANKQPLWHINCNIFYHESSHKIMFLNIKCWIEQPFRNFLINLVMYLIVIMWDCLIKNYLCILVGNLLLISI